MQTFSTEVKATNSPTNIFCSSRVKKRINKQRMEFIRQLQSEGFTFEEIQNIFPRMKQETIINMML